MAKVETDASNASRVVVKFQFMLESVVNIISMRQVIATVNEWLVSYVGDRFLAGTPTPDHAADLWRVPVLYVYPKQGPLGVVGEVAVDSVTGEIRSHPPIDEIKRQALDLYQAKRGRQDTTFLSSKH